MSLRRWEKSRSATVTHTPLHSPISQIHLLPSSALLSSSLQYGVVSRSLPLTGKVLRGYLSPSSAGTGLGIGNPNTEFAPNVSACAMFSEGGVAKIAWGLRSGEVAVMSAIKVSDAGKRTPAKLVRCKVDEEHQGEVIDVAWDASGAAVVSGSLDGTVKLWDAKKTRCLWTSDKILEALVPVALKKILSAMDHGVIVAGLQNGDIHVWAGFDTVLSEQPSVSPSSIVHVKISCPCPADLSHGILFHVPEISSIHVDGTGTVVALLATYKAQAEFYRISVDIKAGTTTPFTKFFNPVHASCPITSILPVSTRQPGIVNFVIVGDLLGSICVYPWSSPLEEPPSQATNPVRFLEAHEDATAVTALAWNGITLATGSAKGSVNVFDALTFELLKTFPSPLPRFRGSASTDENRQAVKQILINSEKDMLVAAVGDRVLAWRAGLIPTRKVVKAKHPPTKHKVLAKGYGMLDYSTLGPGKADVYIEQLNLKQHVSESLSQLKDESAHSRQFNIRAREQSEILEGLGLDEVEVTQYILMLSRDEALEREQNAFASASVMEEVFEGDFSDALTDETASSPSQPSSFMSSWSSSSPPIRSSTRLPPRIVPCPSLSTSNNKVQMSPPQMEEPREAGHPFTSTTSPLSHISTSPLQQSYFPPITNSSSFKERDPQSSSLPEIRKGKAPSSYSAWSRPLVSKSARSTPPYSTSQTTASDYPEGDSDADEDLRLAIELSLAEAQRMSR